MFSAESPVQPASETIGVAGVGWAERENDLGTVIQQPAQFGARQHACGPILHDRPCDAHPATPRMHAIEELIDSASQSHGNASWLSTGPASGGTLIHGASDSSIWVAEGG